MPQRSQRQPRLRDLGMIIETSSGVLSSRRGPAHLALAVPVRDRRIGVGNEFSLPYVVRSTGDRRPERVSIALQYDERALTAIGATARRLDPHARISRGRFRLRAKRAGSTRVLVGVKSTANRPGAEIAVHVDPSSASGASGWWKGLGGLGLALLAAAAIIAFAPRIGSFRTGRNTA